MCSSDLNSTPTTYTTTGSTSFPPNNTWGGSEVWQATVPTYTAGESIFQIDGIYSPSTGNTVWGLPYISALKVGSLSAITANMGTITAGNITLDSSGYIRGGQTDYFTGSGFWLGYNTGTTSYAFSIGTSTNYMKWDATNGLVLQLSSFTNSIAGGNITVSTSSTSVISVGTSRTATATGGTGTVTYYWTLTPTSVTGQASLAISSSTSATVSFTGQVAAGANIIAYATCVATDSNNRTATARITVSLTSTA